MLLSEGIEKTKKHQSAETVPDKIQNRISITKHCNIYHTALQYLMTYALLLVLKKGGALPIFTFLNKLVNFLPPPSPSPPPPLGTNRA